MMVEIGKQIKHRRSQANASLRSLGKASGVHYAALCMIENGKRMPTFATLSKIAKGLECEVHELLKENG